MSRYKKPLPEVPTGKFRKRPPAKTVESRENQMISLAVDRAEKQLMDGTASPNIIVHYLKIGSTKERIEKEILERKKELITAQTEAIQSAKKIEDLYANALRAMRTYSGEEIEES